MQERNQELITSSRNTSLVARRANFDLARPINSERESHIVATKSAIDQLIASKLEANDASLKKHTDSVSNKTYKPIGSSTEHTLSIVEKHNDPLEPPRHRYRKAFDVSVVDTDNRAPILRPPPKKLSKEEKEKWWVPQSVSNWKNSKGLMLDRAKDTSYTASNSLEAVNKRLDLSSALQDVADELSQETEDMREQAVRSSDLKRRLLEQKSKNKSLETEEFCDSRLFHQSHKRPQDYDSELFAPSRTSQIKTKLKKNNVEFESER